MVQTQVLNQMRVEVYKVRIYDSATDEFRVSRRMATNVGVAKMRGEIIPGTKPVLISPDELESGEDWTERDFVPKAVGA
jgi:hypothetical protein